ncbi:MAG TPA: SEC-C domain-containing protein [Phycisphaerae bacterium]|nr:SEC-C domain-containing protein [Phycisphaerae bacterium]HNU46903.1 SEC-C domain-containing protein [Phycisphaerae bacterium]
MNLMAERAELLGRYRRLRALMRDLHSELTRMVPKDTLTQCARKLGLLVHDTLVFDSEEEMSVLMDYCIYDGWVGQHNAVTRFLAKQPYAAGTDQALLLDGMSRARYSLFQVESVAEGVGINCRDVLRGDGGTIVDEGLGNTASHAVVFAGRLVVLPELGMTTGAVLGVDADTLADIVNVLENEAEGVGGADINNLTPPEAAALSSLIIRCVLGRGTPARDAPQEPGRSAETRQPRQSGGERPSRNEPCPCGSGRKYKRCCGRAEQPGA